MRRWPALTALPLLLLTGCGGDDSEAGAAPAPAPAVSTNADGKAVLLAAVGNPEDPDAFDITLTTTDGTDVESLPAGEYEIRVSDQTSIHNFHLQGPGVNEATDVAGREDAVFDVTLEAGDYSYVCDPHESTMKGDFSVT